MQAIVTKFFPCTNTKPDRIQAKAARGSKFFSVNSEKMVKFSGNSEENHRTAARELCEFFCREDVARCGGSKWMGELFTGQLPDGSYAHVFNPND